MEVFIGLLFFSGCVYGIFRSCGFILMTTQVVKILRWEAEKVENQKKRSWHCAFSGLSVKERNS